MARKRRRGQGEGSIYQRKNGYWAAQATVGYHADGTPIKKTFSGKNRKDVLDKLTAALGEKQKGIIIEPNRVTVSEWLDTWLKDYKKNTLRPTTWDSYEVQARCHLKPALGAVKLKDLRPEHLQRVLNEKLAAGLTPRSVRYIHQVIHGALDQAVKNQLVARNVSDMTELPPDKKKEIHPLTLEEAKQLLKAIGQDRLYAAILLEVGTGLRRGELLALTWKDIDLEEATLDVRRGLVRVRNREADRKTFLTFQEPKTKKSRRTIPIPEDAVVELKRHRARQNREKLALGPAYEDGGLVFCTEDGKPIDPRNFSRHFGRLLKTASLPHIRFHDARHTFATIMLELGENPKTVQEILGHSRISTTLDTYSHVSLDLERQAASRLNDALREDSLKRSSK